MHDLHIDCVRDSVQDAYPSSGVTATDGGKQRDEKIPKGDEDSSPQIF